MQIAVELFQAEKNRYEQLLAAIKKEINNLTPPPQAVWVQAAPRGLDEPLILGLLHESLHLTKCVRQLQAGLHRIEKDFDLTIELEGYTKADISELELDGVIALFGVLPATPNDVARQRTKKTLTHREKDRQLKVMSQKLAEVLKSDASLVRRAKDHIDHLLKEDQGAATADIMEWRDILDSYSIQRLASFFTSSSERANRLRQSNPFFAILNPAERTQMIDDLEKKNDTRST